MVTYELPLFVVTIREYLDPSGRSRFGRWFAGLNAPATAKVTTAMVGIEQGDFSNTKGVGAGVHESRIDFGPGYRIYFGRDGDAVVILLGGGIRKRQKQDIMAA
jgi:putative addiction module killer protein